MGVFAAYLLSPGSLHQSTDTNEWTRAEQYRTLDPGFDSPPRDIRPDSPPANRPTQPLQRDTGPKVAIVIDDIGWSTRAIPIYESINRPITFAILPGRPHTKSVYQRWKNRFEFILHMPMEPIGYPDDDPGAMALMTSMGQDEVRSHLLTILDRYPRVAGINNHMGSKFTQDRALMDVVMSVLNEKNMFYMDSRTSPESVAVPAAKSNGVPVISNDVFLDNRKSRDYIRNQLNELVQTARDHGTAVGIGHFQSVETARVLKERMPYYAETGVDFVRLSQLVERGTVTASAPNDGL
jgi:polysaccharide deacetylase 2 family uncharacterized protein YibQ